MGMTILISTNSESDNILFMYHKCPKVGGRALEYNDVVLWPAHPRQVDRYSEATRKGQPVGHTIFMFGGLAEKLTGLYAQNFRFIWKHRAYSP